MGLVAIRRNCKTTRLDRLHSRNLEPVRSDALGRGASSILVSSRWGSLPLTRGTAPVFLRTCYFPVQQAALSFAPPIKLGFTPPKIGQDLGPSRSWDMSTKKCQRVQKTTLCIRMQGFKLMPGGEKTEHISAIDF